MSGLELSDVVKHYVSGDGEHVRAVDGVSLSISPGEFVALYGPSGSGKTTLLLLAAGLMAADAGSIRFDDREIGSLSRRESTRYRRHDVGLIFQSFHLVPGASAAENAGLKLQADGMTMAEACDAAQPWLERVGLAGRADSLVDRLSMGECQRVAIARALVNGPRLVLADEPTGNLDSKRSRETLGLLAELCHEHQLAVLLVTHDPQATAFVDRVYTLRDGQLRDGLDVDLAAVIGS